MVDALKIAAKVALIVVITGAIIALFTGLVIPSINLVPLAEAVGKGKAIINYWLPDMYIWLTLGIAIIILEVGVLGVRLALIAVKWIMKVNE